MPTMRSTSADRPAISGLDVTPWARIASLNWAPIDLTGLSAFIALCMTTDRSFQRTAASWRSVSPTRLRPAKVTLPPVISAGGTSSWAIANSSVDLPQPDSPTTPMNSPGPRSKLTSSTARTVPRSMKYSTVRPLTWRIGSGTGHPLPSHRPQRGVADLVEGVVEQGERRPQRGDAGSGGERPHGLPGLQRRVVLRPVEHRPPALRVRVAQADELQAGGEQDRVQRVGQEARHDQRGHRRDDLDRDDVEPPLAADPGRLQIVPAAQRQRLRAQLARGVGPAGHRDDQDQHQRAAAVRVPGDDDQEREQRDDQQHVGEQAPRAAPPPPPPRGGAAPRGRP